MKCRVGFFFFFFISINLAAQCPQASFDLPDSACKGQDIFLANASTGAISYYWDFCETELGEDASVSHLTSLNDAFRGAYAFDFIKDPVPKVISLRISGLINYMPISDELAAIENPVPISGLAGAFELPRAIQILKEDNRYYALVTNSRVGESMTLVDFGTTISNSATFSRLDGFGISATNGIDVIRNGNDYDVFVGENSGNTIYHLQFKGSITNVPTVSSFNVTGATSINDIEVLKTCDGITGIVSSLSNDKLFILDFSHDLASSPLVSELMYVGDPILDPAKFDVAFDQGSYFLLLHTDDGIIHRLSFGNSLRNVPISEILWSQSVNGHDIKLVHDLNRWKALFVDYSVANRRLSVLEFNNSCTIAPSWSDEESPVINIKQPGDYKIHLTAKDADGYVRAITKDISIIDKTPATVDFNAEGICAGFETVFSSVADKPIDSYTWSFDDGNSSLDENPIHTFSNSDNFNVNLLAIDVEGCRISVSKSLAIYNPPTPDFTLPPNLLCTNNEFLFPTTTSDTYNGNLSYQWFVDDTPVATTRDLQHTFTTTGPKDIKLVTSIPGCSNEITKTTPFIQPGPVVDFSVTGACEGEVFSFQNEISDAVETYLWDFGNGNTSGDPNPTEQFTSFGDYSVSLTATNAIGCKNVKTRVVAVHSKPVVDFRTDGPPNACSGTSTFFTNLTTNPDGGEITQWLWDFNDSNDASPSSETAPEHIFALQDTYPVALTATAASGCIGTGNRNITIYPSPSTDFQFTPACQDVPVVFTGPPDANIIDSYWEIGTAYYEVKSPTHTFKAAGDFPLHLEVIAANGCIAAREQTIHVPEPLTPDFSVLKNCVDVEAIFTNVTTGSDAVVATQWLLNEGETFTDSPLRYTFTEQENQQVTMKVTTVSGCEYAVGKSVEIFSAPQASFSATPPAGAYPLQVKFTNNSQGATHYQWDFVDGSGATSAELSPVHTFQDEGNFEVVLTALNAQECADSFTDVISTVAPLPDAAVEQIILTPEADGSLKLIVTIWNKGNSVLMNVPLEINFSGNLVLRHILTEPILPTTKYNFVFKTGIVKDRTLRYLCVSLDVKNDLHLEDNRFCEEFDDRLLSLPAYPNPATSVLYAEWISETASTVRISLLDAMGRTVFHHEMNALEGINRQPFDVSGLPDGIYYLLIEDGRWKNCQRILVMTED